MTKKLLLLILWLSLLPVMAGTDNTISFSLLSYLPDNLDCLDQRNTFPQGVYVDRVNFSMGQPQIDCSTQRLLYAKLDSAPDLLKEINQQKIFAWGYYNDDFTLSNLDFISLDNQIKVYHLSSDNIRGLAKAKGNLVLFFTSRNPPTLKAYNMDDGSCQTVKVEDYLPWAENVGVKISETGKVMFTGTGLQEYSPQFTIPESFLKNNLKDYDGVWNLFLNRPQQVVLVSTQKAQKRVIVWDKPNDKWRYFELDKSYISVKSYGDDLLFQTDADNQYAKIVYLFHFETDELKTLKLMPFTKIVYYSQAYTLLAQPYRLLLAANTDKAMIIQKIIDYPLAWYIKITSVEQK